MCQAKNKTIQAHGLPWARREMKTCIIYTRSCEHAGVAEARSVWQCGEKQCCREGRGLGLKDLSCLLSELELFLVGHPVGREQFDTEIGVIRLHFRSVSGSSVEEDGSEGTERETDASLRKLLRSPREELMVAWAGAVVVEWWGRDRMEKYLGG